MADKEEVQTVTIKNPGPQQIHIAVSSNRSALSLQNVTVAIPPGEEKDVKFLPHQALRIVTEKTK